MQGKKSKPNKIPFFFFRRNKNAHWRICAAQMYEKEKRLLVYIVRYLSVVDSSYSVFIAQNKTQKNIRLYHNIIQYALSTHANGEINKPNDATAVFCLGSFTECSSLCVFTRYKYIQHEWSFTNVYTHNRLVRCRRGYFARYSVELSSVLYISLARQVELSFTSKSKHSFWFIFIRLLKSTKFASNKKWNEMS